MKLSADQKIDLREVLKDLHKYRPRRKAGPGAKRSRIMRSGPLFTKTPPGIWKTRSLFPRRMLSTTSIRSATS